MRLRDLTRVRGAVLAAMLLLGAALPVAGHAEALVSATIVPLGGAVAGGLLVVGIDAPAQDTKEQVGHALRRGQDVSGPTPSTRDA